MVQEENVGRAGGGAEVGGEIVRGHTMGSRRRIYNRDGRGRKLRLRESAARWWLSLSSQAWPPTSAVGLLEGPRELAALCSDGDGQRPGGRELADPAP